MSDSEKNIPRGLTLGLLAYLIWGSFPVIIKSLGFASPLEIVIWRAIFGLIAGLLFIFIARSQREFLREMKLAKVRRWIVVSSITILANWTIYVFAVSSNHTVESSLGYFINPLVTILLAIFFLGERLRRLQWIALAFGLIAVIILTIDYGRPPWIAFGLAASFGAYSLAKNKMGSHITALHSYTLETILIAPLAFIGLAVMANTQEITFFTHGWLAAVGLAMYGVATAVPLILFGSAAKHLPLSWIGFMQYLTPTLQLASALLILHEPMPPVRWIGFALVWVGLGFLSADMIRHQRRK